MHEEYMRKAIVLAKKGVGHVNPNPLVGAVIVKDDKIIGQGYHKVYGGPHAEVNAVASAKETCEGAISFVHGFEPKKMSDSYNLPNVTFKSYGDNIAINFRR